MVQALFSVSDGSLVARKARAMQTQPIPPSNHRCNRPTRVLRSMVSWLVESDRQFRVMQNMVESERKY